MSMHEVGWQEKVNAQATQAVPAPKDVADADPLNDELQAMRSVARTLEKLPYGAQVRVVDWLSSRFPRLADQMLASGKAYP
jgi:hypothetical protein